MTARNCVYQNFIYLSINLSISNLSIYSNIYALPYIHPSNNGLMEISQLKNLPLKLLILNLNFSFPLKIVSFNFDFVRR